MVMQRTQDRVQFVDGGIWQEEHGDHVNDSKQASRLLGFTHAGACPQVLGQSSEQWRRVARAG